MRLIDADKLLEFLTRNMDFLVKPNTEKLTQCEIKKIIHKQPTAYDMDKVVKKVEEISKYGCTSSEIIEVIKAGGVNE